MTTSPTVLTVQHHTTRGLDNEERYEHAGRRRIYRALGGQLHHIGTVTRDVERPTDGDWLASSPFGHRIVPFPTARAAAQDLLSFDRNHHFELAPDDSDLSGREFAFLHALRTGSPTVTLPIVDAQ